MENKQIAERLSELTDGFTSKWNIKTLVYTPIKYDLKGRPLNVDRNLYVWNAIFIGTKKYYIKRYYYEVQISLNPYNEYKRRSFKPFMKLDLTPDYVKKPTLFDKIAKINITIKEFFGFLPKLNRRFFISHRLKIGKYNDFSYCFHKFYSPKIKNLEIENWGSYLGQTTEITIFFISFYFTKQIK